MVDRQASILKRMIDFTTDTPTSLPDLNNRVKKLPLWYKATTIATTATLVACNVLGIGKNEKTNVQLPDTEPTPKPEIDPSIQESMLVSPPVLEMFTKHTPLVDIVQTKQLTTQTLPESIRLSAEDEGLDPNNLEVTAFEITDSKGQNQNVYLIEDTSLIAQQKFGYPDGTTLIETQFYYATDIDGASFVPQGEGSSAKGRLFRIFSWTNDNDPDISFIGLGILGVKNEWNPTIELYTINWKDSSVKYFDPFSKVEVTSSLIDMPGASKVVTAPIAYRELTPTAEVLTLPEGTLIPVEQVPAGLEKVLKVDAQGVGTININGKIIPIHIKDAEGKIAYVSQIAGSENFLIGPFEYTPNGEFVEPRKVSIYDKVGKSLPYETISQILPRISEQDTELIMKFWSQTADQNIFDTLAARIGTTKAKMRANHFMIKQSNSGDGVLVIPMPDDTSTRQGVNQFRNMLPGAFPVWLVNDGPALMVGDLGIGLPIAYLNHDGSTTWSTAIIPIDKYQDIAPIVSNHSIVNMFINEQFPGSQQFLTKYLNKKPSVLDQNVLSDTFFEIKYSYN